LENCADHSWSFRSAKACRGESEAGDAAKLEACRTVLRLARAAFNG
jgi:hypothetical protein